MPADPTFSIRFEPELAIYRVFRLNAEGGVASAEILDARSDDEAIGKAQVTANGYGLDLWEGARFLGSYPPRPADAFIRGARALLAPVAEANRSGLARSRGSQ